MAMNFPNKKNTITKIKNKANLGMDLEKIINESNEYYLNNDMAVIHKKPTPVQIVKVDYPVRSKAVITEAYYKTPSTTDYNGIYKGKYIDFEAKESHSLTSFPLKNIHPHQITHLSSIIKHGGIGFFIILFSKYNEFYLVKFDLILEYWDNSFKEGRQSIPYQIIKERGYLIKEEYIPRLPYLRAVNEVYFKGNN